MKLVANCETVHLCESLELPRSVMHAVYPDQTIKFKHVPFSVCSHIITDRQWLQENLLCFGSNAAKYSPPGSCISFSISVRLESELSLGNNPVGLSERAGTSTAKDDAKMVLVECEDDGIGMSEAAMSSLFAPFQQAQRLAGGTGLGLFSLANRMKALNGHCGVRGRGDGAQGCCFWFAFPYRPDEDAAKYHLAAAGAMHKPTQQPPSTEMSPKACALNNYSSISMNASANPSTSENSQFSAFLPRQGLAPLRVERTPSASKLKVDVSERCCISQTECCGGSMSLKKELSSGKLVVSPMARKRDCGLSPASLRINMHLLEQHSWYKHQQHLTRMYLNAASIAAQPNQPSPLRVYHADMDADASSATTPTASILGNIRVLLADDTVSVRKVTTHLLQRAGFDVSTATNGVEALDKLSSEVFDVVLMDLHMPVMDGIEAVRRLRAQEAADEAAGADDRRLKSLHTIVIALTANSTAGLSDETKAVGFDAFLEKPLKVEKFQLALLSLFNKCK
jgi:CheY-like chemotaxis protein